MTRRVVTWSATFRRRSTAPRSTTSAASWPCRTTKERATEDFSSILVSYLSIRSIWWLRCCYRKLWVLPSLIGWYSQMKITLVSKVLHNSAWEALGRIVALTLLETLGFGWVGMGHGIASQHCLQEMGFRPRPGGCLALGGSHRTSLHILDQNCSKC